jgi:glucose/arabinose dehydrogenase
VHRFLLKEGSLLPDTTAELVISGYPKQNQHETKSLTFDGDGHIYVNIGAPANACMEKIRTPGSPGMDPCPLLEHHAGIWQYDANTLNQNAYADGKRYATGLRNVVALDWNFAGNHLYAVQHGRDQLNQFFPDLYTPEQSAELPAEEFFRLEDGSNAGWPYCYYDWQKNKKVTMPEYGGDGEITDRCEDKLLPELAFPGHLAPNDLLFYTGDMFPEKYKNGAFIAFHGSWNRGPQDQYGFFVVFVPFSNGRVSGEYEIFASGFEGAEPVKNSGDAMYRPCGLALAPDGSIYVSDDAKGRIWRIIYTGE